MKKNKVIRKKYIFSSGIIFQIVFLLEIILFYNIIIVDPSVHNISYDNWKWFVLEWDPPEYWQLYGDSILKAVNILNIVFQMIFGINLVYVFINNKIFFLKKRSLILIIVLLTVFDVIFHNYIKYNARFYRIYMYSTYNEFISLYMIYCGKGCKNLQNKEKFF